MRYPKHVKTHKTKKFRYKSFKKNKKISTLIAWKKVNFYGTKIFRKPIRAHVSDKGIKRGHTIKRLLEL